MPPPHPAPPSGAPGPSRWNPWPLCIAAYFTLALIGCGTFIVFCARHPPDLVAADYYEQEVHYQSQLDRLQHARQGAALTTVSYEPDQHRIKLALPPGPAGSKVTGNIELYRPSAVNQDRQFKLDLDPQGVQSIDTANLQPGLWKVRVWWSANGQDYYLDQKVVVK
jgi:hypothetical protein